MTLVFLNHPAVAALLLATLALSVLGRTVKRGGVLLPLLAGVCAVAMLIAALACAVSYSELVLLLAACCLPVLLPGREGNP